VEMSDRISTQFTSGQPSEARSKDPESSGPVFGQIQEATRKINMALENLDPVSSAFN